MVNSVSSSAANGLAQYSSLAKRPEPPSAEDLFSRISQDVGGDGQKITKEQLTSAIKKMEEDGGDAKKLEMLKKLAENFNNIAGDDGELTVDELKKDMEAHKPPKQGSSSTEADWQDPSTITKDQLEPPIDIKV